MADGRKRVVHVPTELGPGPLPLALLEARVRAWIVARQALRR